ncbi:MAG: DUF1015 family protein [Lachnospiraceae bacterium]|nr:DUF1015 family protein [Lachnospiraceae bacterium]
MADIRAFSCVRPRADLAERIAALPYDVYNRQEAKAEIAREPLSFLRIDRAETNFDDSVDTYAPEVYEKAKALLREMIEDGSFVKDGKSCYYVYELTMEGRAQTGLVACASIDDYMGNIIKKHENTREEKEQDRICHVDVCNAQTGPIFLAYRAKDSIRQTVARVKDEKPVYDFLSPDGIRHAVWVMENESDIQTVSEAFAGMDSIYIADGHHRCASAVKVGLNRRQSHPGYDGTEEFNFFLAVLFPDEDLMIMPYNRVVKDLNGLSETEFMDKLSQRYEIERRDTEVTPGHKGQVGMYLKGQWYLLTPKPELISDDPVEGLDVSVLQNYVLSPILGIDDPRTDKRIDFVGGIRGNEELMRRVHTDMEVAFSMYPTSIQELFEVADAGMLMPPKSTWFEPKLRSGIFIHEL